MYVQKESNVYVYRETERERENSKANVVVF